MGKFLRWFTFLNKARIEAIEAEHAANPGARVAQRLLADEVSQMIHGMDETKRAIACAAALFGGDIRSLEGRSAADVAADLPGVRAPRGTLPAEGRALLDLLVETQLAASKREAREFLESGAVQVNGERATLDSKVTAQELLHGSYAFIRRGKRQWAVAEFTA